MSVPILKGKISKVEIDILKLDYTKLEISSKENLLILLTELQPSIECLNSIYDNKYSTDRFYSIFKTPRRDVEKSDLSVLIMYDIKDSSGARDPRKRESSPKCKIGIVEALNNLSAFTDSGALHYDIEERDDKVIYLSSFSNIEPVLKTLLEVTAIDYGLFLAVSIVSIHDTQKEVYKAIGSGNPNIIENTPHHTLAARLLSLQDKGKVKTLDRDNVHTITITKEVLSKLASDNINVFPNDGFQIDTLAVNGSNEQEVYSKELQSHVRYKVFQVFKQISLK